MPQAQAAQTPISDQRRSSCDLVGVLGNRLPGGSWSSVAFPRNHPTSLPQLREIFEWRLIRSFPGFANSLAISLPFADTRNRTVDFDLSWRRWNAASCFRPARP